MWQYLKLQKVHHHYRLPFCLDQLSFFFIYFSKGLRKDSGRNSKRIWEGFQTNSHRISQQIPKKIPKGIFKRYSKRIWERIPERIPECPKELSKEFLKELPKEFLKEFPKEFLKNSQKNKSYLSLSRSLPFVVLSLF